MGIAMFIKKEAGPKFVTLKDGTRMSRSDLPPADTSRWVASRKARVVQAVEAGLITVETACEIYGLSGEELQSWLAAARAHGADALKATNVQRYRQPKGE